MSFVALWLAVGSLGGVGAVLRWAVDTRVPAARELPAGTLVVNLTGAIVLGLLTGLAVRGDTRLLLATALIGSFTTFSTWMLESERLAEEHRTVAAAANVVVSLLAGVACVALGRWLGEQL